MKIGDVHVSRVERTFYARPADVVAPELIGFVLVHATPEGTAAGRIVEVEAYLGSRDAAAHSFRGKTARNASMFGPAGRAYVYFSYGMHYCINVVVGGPERGQAVLLRALEPLAGIDLMRARRGRDDLRDLCRGPGRLTQALGIGPEHDGADFVRGKLGIWRPRDVAEEIDVAIGPRIGITKAADLPLRFSARGNRFVSATVTRA
jgi:DNA-3-methyladenine glycosylase